MDELFNVDYPYQFFIEKYSTTLGVWQEIKQHKFAGEAIQECEKIANRLHCDLRVVEYKNGKSFDSRVVMEITPNQHGGGTAVSDDKKQYTKHCVQCDTSFKVPHKPNNIKKYSWCLKCSKQFKEPKG